MLNREDTPKDSARLCKHLSDGLDLNALREDFEAVCNTQGHPIWQFIQENRAIEGIAATLEESFGKDCFDKEAFKTLRQISLHYMKKGDLIYPLLSESYGIDGPGMSLWTVDDSIRADLASIEKISDNKEKNQALANVLLRIRGMIFKEENILFLVCLSKFSLDDWYGIYADSKAYEIPFELPFVSWEEAEHKFSRRQDHGEGGISDHVAKHVSDEVSFAGGTFRLDELESFLNTLPCELTFVDKNDINRYFNEGPKVFKRPRMALGRSVVSCHPPKIQAMVERILADFKSGKRDVVDVWTEKNDAPYWISYRALRNSQGEYLGCLEIAQDMSHAKKHFS